MTQHVIVPYYRFGPDRLNLDLLKIAPESQVELTTDGKSIRIAPVVFLSLDDILESPSAASLIRNQVQSRESSGCLNSNRRQGCRFFTTDYADDTDESQGMQDRLIAGMKQQRRFWLKDHSVPSCSCSCSAQRCS